MRIKLIINISRILVLNIKIGDNGPWTYKKLYLKLKLRYCKHIEFKNIL